MIHKATAAAILAFAALNAHAYSFEAVFNFVPWSINPDNITQVTLSGTYTDPSLALTNGISTTATTSTAYGNSSWAGTLYVSGVESQFGTLTGAPNPSLIFNAGTQVAVTEAALNNIFLAEGRFFLGATTPVYISGNVDLVSFTDTTASTAPVPEPQTCAMLLTGLGLVGFVAMRRRPGTRNGSTLLTPVARYRSTGAPATARATWRVLWKRSTHGVRLVPAITASSSATGVTMMSRPVNIQI